MQPSVLIATLRGELFKAGDGNTAYKLRWFELVGQELRWFEGEGGAPRGCIDVTDARITLDPYDPNERRNNEERFGFRLAPSSGARVYALQASSAEERRLWVDAIETVAQPDVMRSTLGDSGREVRLTKPPPGQPIGLDLGSAPGMPCVTVLRADGDAAAKAGLLAGDVVLALGNTVLRNADLALRVFKQAVGTITLRLATWNREVAIVKRDGKAGIVVEQPQSGIGVIVTSLLPGGAGQHAGLQVGDRLLAIDRELERRGHENFSTRIRNAAQELKVVVSGFTRALILRKDAEGMLGIRCSTGPPPRGLQGGTVTEILPRSTARDAGLRTGDLIVAIDGHIITTGDEATRVISSSQRTVHVVVWRPRPDTDDEPPVLSPSRNAPTSTRAKGAAPSRSGGGEADGREWYYAELDEQWRPAGAQAPSNPIFEDLTVP